jgi:hypothetical protein
MYFMLDEAVYASKDAGNTWEKTYQDPTPDEATGPKPTALLGVDSTDPSVVLARSQRSTEASCQPNCWAKGVVMRSADGGHSWQAIYEEESPVDITRYPPDCGWQRPSRDVPLTVGGTTTVAEFAFAADVWDGSGRPGGICLSVDGGKSWTFASLPIEAGLRVEHIDQVFLPPGTIGHALVHTKAGENDGYGERLYRLERRGARPPFLSLLNTPTNDFGGQIFAMDRTTFYQHLDNGYHVGSFVGRF